MPKQLNYTVFKTKPGWIGVLTSKVGLLAVTLPRTTRQQAFSSLGERSQRAISSPELFSDLEQRFQYYYSGTKTTFTDKLDFSNATEFQKQVWKATRLIPYGETRGYGWVAKQIGKPLAARAVGQALKKIHFLSLYLAIGSSQAMARWAGLAPDWR